MLWGGVMEEFYSGFAQRARDLAEKADPFTRRRLLDLAKRYGRQEQARRQRQAAAASAHQPARHALRRRSMRKGGAAEVKCDACGGAGHQPTPETVTCLLPTSGCPDRSMD